MLWLVMMWRMDHDCHQPVAGLEREAEFVACRDANGTKKIGTKEGFGIQVALPHVSP